MHLIESKTTEDSPQQTTRLRDGLFLYISYYYAPITAHIAGLW